MRLSKTLCLVIALLLCGGVGSPLSAQSLTTVRIGLIPSDFAGEIYYAKDMGFFEKAGLRAEITELNNGPAIAAAVVGGALDFGYSNIISLAIAHDKGLPITIVTGAYIYNPNTATTGLLAVAKSSPINSGKDLNGKTIAVGALYNVTDIATRAWIDSHGGDSRTVHFIELPAPAWAQAIRSGRVDAAPIDSSLDPLLGTPGDSLRLLGKAFDAIGSNYVVGAWFATKDWVSAHPAETKAFVEAIKASARWANTHHHESAAILGKYLKEDTQQIEALPRVGYSIGVTPASIQSSIDVAARYHVIKAPFSAKELLSPLSQ
jgi:NitT/TauT family transport system substrate-binding protein